MTPAARIAAVIEILAEVAEGRRPADEILRLELKRRRYIGGGDRRAIGDMLYGVLRRIVAIDHRLGLPAPSARLRVAAWLAEREGSDALAQMFTGERYAPAPLEPGELSALSRDVGLQPAWAEANLPEWLVPSFARRFGNAWSAHAEALNRPARIDLRVNRLKATREQALEALRAAGVEAEPTPYAPHGVTVAGRFVLGGLQAYKDGWVEPQDEASQLVAAAVGAEAGMTVIDLCAGAGGKTLALAAATSNLGRLIACDSAPDRLARLGPRADRAGAQVETAAPDDPALLGVADRVLVDAPCSGTGMWRRQPDARLRLDAAELRRLTAIQSGLIAHAARLCRPGGRIVYAVCSVLPEEGPDRIVEALAQGRALSVVPPAVMRGPGLDALPPACAESQLGLQLDPLTTNTDGFFVAALDPHAG